MTAPKSCQYFKKNSKSPGTKIMKYIAMLIRKNIGIHFTFFSLVIKTTPVS